MIFVDTNILIDFVCRREGFLESARKLFSLCCMGKIELTVSSLSLVNTMYIARKHGSSVVSGRLSRLSAFIKVADMTADSALWALSSGWKDYEDAVQYSVAIKEGADCIVTRNKKDFADATIPVYTAEEALEVIATQL